jgi:hypothetical protein
MLCAVRVPSATQVTDDIDAAAQAGAKAPRPLRALSAQLRFMPFFTRSPTQLGACVRQAVLWGWRNIRADLPPRTSLFMVDDRRTLFLLATQADNADSTRIRVRVLFPCKPGSVDVVRAIEAAVHTASCALSALDALHAGLRDPDELAALVQQKDGPLPVVSDTDASTCSALEFSRVELTPAAEMDPAAQLALLLRLLLPLRSPLFHICHAARLPIDAPPRVLLSAIARGDTEATMRELCAWHTQKPDPKTAAPLCFQAIVRPAAALKQLSSTLGSLRGRAKDPSATWIDYAKLAKEGASAAYGAATSMDRYTREPLEELNAGMDRRLWEALPSRVKDHAVAAGIPSPQPPPTPDDTDDAAAAAAAQPPVPVVKPLPALRPTAKTKATDGTVPLWDPAWAKAYELHQTLPLEAFQKALRDLWPDIVEHRPKTNQCNTTGGGGAPAPEFLELSKFQEFLRRWFTPNMPRPLKGVLLHASTGTGKTCAAIAAASSSFQQQYEVVWWVGTPGVRNERNKNLARNSCSVITRQWLQADPKAHHLPGAAATDGNNNLTDSGRSFLRNHKAVGAGWMPSTKSYRQLYNYISGKSDAADAEVNATRPKGRTRQKQADKLFKTLLIIDEAHNPVSDSKVSDPHNQISLAEFEVVQKAIWRSWEVSGQDSVRVLLMTATPVRGQPVSFFRLLNCVVEGHPFPNTQAELDALADPHTGLLPPQVTAELAEKMKGAVLYTDAGRDASRFPVVRRMYHVRVPIADEHKAKILTACRFADKAKQAACLQRKENSALGQAAVFDGKVNMPRLRKLQEMWAQGRTVEPVDNPFSTHMDQLMALAPKAGALVAMIRAIDEHEMKHLGHKSKHLVLTRQDQFEGAKFLAFAMLVFGYRLTMRAEGRKLVLGYLPPGPIATGSNNFICLTKTQMLGAEPSRDTFLAPTPGARPADCDAAVEDTKTAPVLRRGLFNLPENRHGEYVRIAILDRSFTEGVDVFDTPHCHLMESWGSGEMLQGAGRVGRQCGSSCLKVDPELGGWPVNLYVYTGHYMDGKSADDGAAQLTGPHTEAASLMQDLGHVALGDQLLNLSAYAATDRLCNPDLNPFGTVDALNTIDLAKPRDPFPLAEHIEWDTSGNGALSAPPRPPQQQRPAAPAVATPPSVPVVAVPQPLPVVVPVPQPVAPLPPTVQRNLNLSPAERVLELLRNAGLQVPPPPPPSDAALSALAAAAAPPEPLPPSWMGSARSNLSKLKFW